MTLSKKDASLIPHPLARNASNILISGAIMAAMSGCSALGDDIPASADTIAALVSQMTLEEKIQMLHGAENNLAGAGTIAGIERLGIPSIMLTDGPAGARNPNYKATAMPAPVALASSFNPELAYHVGQVIGKEARAQGQDVLLSPMVNIVRTPQAGRNFETLGEDPLLAGKMVAEEIKGVQDAGLMATVKHFVANNQETDRMTIDTLVDEQALREIYLPAFKRAVQEAGVASIMCAYNKLAINGENSAYACANKELLTNILRDEWGYEGFVMTDWFAGIPGVFTPEMKPTPTHILAGLDVEMPAQFMFGDLLLNAVKNGDIEETYIDRSVTRILTQMAHFGLLDGSAPERADIEALARQHAKVALKAAVEGAVLLKNDNKILPLSSTDLDSLLIIGPTGGVLNYGGGGSSRVKPMTALESPYMALTNRAGDNAVIHYLPGIDLDGVTVPADLFKDLVRKDQDGQEQKAVNINLTGDSLLPAHGKTEWIGELVAPETGEYDIKVQAKNAVVQLSLDGGETVILDSASAFNPLNSVIPTRDGLENSSVRVHLNAGEVKSIRLVATAGEVGAFSYLVADKTAPAQVRLAWETPSQRKMNVAKAVEAAKKAKTVLVFGYNEGTEGADRKDLSLPNNQDELIAQIAAVNKNTVVVLNTGDPVTMPWANNVPAIMQMWYPGQEGGEATADLLLGNANLSGKLPVSFPASMSDLPMQQVKQFPGEDGQLVYDEGIYVGYRWYDKQNLKPLFPFGHGLSYTEFSYSDARITQHEGGYRVEFKVTNTGEKAGVDVPQLYLGAPEQTHVPVAVKSLAGFERVALEAGQSQSVDINIDSELLNFWDVDNHQWMPVEGERAIYLGHSSGDYTRIGSITHQ